MNKAKLTLKLSALAGVATTSTVTSHAAVVASPTVGSGISPPSDGSFYWDVDGDSTTDFHFWRRDGDGGGGGPIVTTYGGTYTSGSSSGQEANFDEVNGGRLVGERSYDNIQKLQAGFLVGPIMAGGMGFASSPQASVTITNGGSVGGDANYQGWNFGETGYFGFKFTSGESTYYGWGQLSIGGPNGFTVTQAFYENTPDTPIEVGSTTSAVPEPAASAALLGLGAAGVAVWRRRRAG